MQVLLCCLALLCCASVAVPVNITELAQLFRESNQVVAFYNIYLSGHYMDIVHEQVSTIKGNGLIDRLDRVYYATIGQNGSSYAIEEPKFVHVAHHGDEGEEIQTLSLLYQFCHANPNSKVLYFHDKGSLHNTTYNENFRHMLNCYVLNSNCLATLDTHDVCGWRISPVPFIHYSGNFWWARCSYVNTLVDPLLPKVNETYIALAETLNGCVGVKGRYFAETWIGTAPRIYPADCMNSSIENDYVAYTYKMPPGAQPYCHGPGVPSGLPCTTASTFTDVEHFKGAINAVLSSRKPECRDNRREVVRRTQILYGQDPHTYLEWMDRLGRVPLPPNGTLIRYDNSLCPRAGADAEYDFSAAGLLSLCSLRFSSRW
jgi:hypothetical protein